MDNNHELDTKAMEFISEYKELTDDNKTEFIKKIPNDVLVSILKNIKNIASNKNPDVSNEVQNSSSTEIIISDDLKKNILKYISQDESKAKEIVNSIDDTRQLMNVLKHFAKNITETIEDICSLIRVLNSLGRIHDDLNIVFDRCVKESMIQSSKTKIQEFSAFLNAIELSDEKKLIEMDVKKELTNTIKQTGKLKMVVEVFIKEIIERIDKIIANEKEKSMNQLENLNSLKKRIRTLLYKIFANVLSKSNSRHKQMIVLKEIEDSIRMIKEDCKSVDEEVFAKILEKIYDKKPNNTEAVKKTFIAIVYMYSSNGYAINTKDKNLDVVLNKILEKIDGKRLKLILEHEKNQIYENIEKVTISDNMSVVNAANTLINDMDYITAAIALGNMECSGAADILERIRSYPRGNLYNAVLLSCMSASHAAGILQCMNDIPAAITLEYMDFLNAAGILQLMINKEAAEILQCMYALNAAEIVECMSDKKVAAGILECIILECSDDWKAADILQCMKDKKVAADILQCMSDTNAAFILECMSTNDVGVDSAAKILQRMSTNGVGVGSAAKILQCMKNANNKFDSNSVAKILQCMKDANNKFDSNSAAKILECMSTNDVGVDSAAKILQRMKDKNVCSAEDVLGCMIDNNVTAKIQKRMSILNAAGILRRMSDTDAADILQCMSVDSAAEILQCMSTDSVGVDSAAKILQRMSTNDVGVDSAAEILGFMKDNNVGVGSAAKILECMSTNSVGVDSAAKILQRMKDKNVCSAEDVLGCMIDNNVTAKIQKRMSILNAAGILRRMSDTDAADILQCMSVDSAAEILQCMSTDSVGVDSAAKILQRMSTNDVGVGSVARILQCMSTNDVGVDSAADILQCMSTDSVGVGSVARILQCMSTNDVGVDSAAKILQRMKDKNVCSAEDVLGCMIDNNVTAKIQKRMSILNAAATILGCMKDKNVAADILQCMSDTDAAFILKCMSINNVKSAADILQCMSVDSAAGILQCMSVDSAAGILRYMGIYNVERVAEILQCMKDNSDIGAERVAEILDCISHKNPDLRNDIQKCMDGIRIAKELNEIGVSNIDEIKKMLKDSECEITAILFKTLNNNVAKAFVTKVMTSEDMCILINELIRTNNYEVMYKLLSAIGINTSKDESHTSNDNNSKKQEKQNVYVVVQVMKVLADMIQTMIGMEDKRIDWENVIFREFVTYTINHIFMKEEETKKLIIDIGSVYNTVFDGNNQKTGINYKGNEQQNGSENSLTKNALNIEDIGWNWIEKIAFDILFNLLNNGEEFIDPKYEPIVKQIIEKLKTSANNHEVSQAKEQTGTDGDDKTIVEIDIPDNVPIKVKPIWIMILNYLQGEEKKPLMILFTVLFLACLSVNNQSIDVTQQPAVQANK
ncbi:hypothetical protein OCOL_000470 [Ordospora colligata]